MMEGMKLAFLKITSLACLFFIGLDAGRAQSSGGPQEAKLLGLVQSWADGVGENRPDTLDSILDDNYQHIHGTGLMEKKTQFLEAFRNGSRKYKPIQLQDVRIRTFDGFALVTGVFPLQVEARGKTIEGVNRFCMTLVERPTGWKILQFQATALSSKP